MVKLQCMVDSSDRWEFPLFSETTDSPLNGPDDRQIACRQGCARRLWKSLSRQVTPASIPDSSRQHWGTWQMYRSLLPSNRLGVIAQPCSNPHLFDGLYYLEIKINEHKVQIFKALLKLRFVKRKFEWISNISDLGRGMNDFWHQSFWITVDTAKWVK